MTFHDGARRGKSTRPYLHGVVLAPKLEKLVLGRRDSCRVGSVCITLAPFVIVSLFVPPCFPLLLLLPRLHRILCLPADWSTLGRTRV
jgi:hypothetical protein